MTLKERDLASGWQARASNKGAWIIPILSFAFSRTKLKLFTSYKKILMVGFCYGLLSKSFVEREFLKFPQ